MIIIRKTITNHELTSLRLVLNDVSKFVGEMPILVVLDWAHLHTSVIL